MKSIADAFRKLLGTVRLRQLTDRLRHQLSFVPGLYVIGGIGLAQLTLGLDRALSDQTVPTLLATTVDSARSVFTAIAGGLITSITLLLSMMLITVQLASSQFSPRTIRDWFGDRWLKHTIGVALGTTVFSLLALRSTRSFGDDGGETVPHSSVIVAVVLGVVALFGVVRTVDHITRSLQIGTVARRIASDTAAVVENSHEVGAGQDPRGTPSLGNPDAVVDRDDPGRDDSDHDSGRAVPEDAIPIEAPASGWVQQIDTDTIVDRLPDGSSAFVTVPLGAFVSGGTPLMWVSPPPPEDHASRTELLDAFALGGTRTMQQDVGFGIVQLTDIAVRALSPGINDPSTATDVIVHLGDLMLALWAQPVASARLTRDGRTLVRRPVRHEEYLRQAFDPIRRYGAGDPVVLVAVVRALALVRSEAERRDLPGDIGPLNELIADVRATADTDGWSEREIDELTRLAQ